MCFIDIEKNIWNILENGKERGLPRGNKEYKKPVQERDQYSKNNERDLGYIY